MSNESPRPWFAAAPYGFGASWPIAPQGWAVLAAYLLVTGIFVLMAESGDRLLAIIGGVVFFVATLGFVLIVARRTRGGWRWRWGEPD